MEVQTSLYRVLEYIESFKPSFGLMMSLHEQDLHKNDLREKDPKKKGFLVCDPQATNRSDFIRKVSGRYKSNIMPEMIVGLSLGLDPGLYPSACVEDCEDVQDTEERIFLGPRAIRDCKSHFSRTEPSKQALRFRRNALIWKGKKGEEGEKRKKDQKGKRRKKC